MDAWLVGSQGSRGFKVGSKDTWLARSQDPQCLVFSLSVAISLKERLACLQKGMSKHHVVWSWKDRPVTLGLVQIQVVLK